METCEDILETKGKDVFVIAPEATVFDAVEAMCGWRVGALLVGTVDMPRGIISERDVMARVVLQRLSPEETRVEQVMTRDVVCAELRTTQREAMAVMTERCCCHLPVVIDRRVVGVISIGDLVRSASREQEIEVKMLSEYIHGAVS